MEKDIERERQRQTARESEDATATGFRFFSYQQFDVSWSFLGLADGEPLNSQKRTRETQKSAANKTKQVKNWSQKKERQRERERNR